MKISKIILYTLLVFLLQSCKDNSSKRRNIQEYYFPVADLDKGLVYEYETAGDPRNPPFYYYYRNIRDAADLYLTGTYYDYDFTPIQFVREEVVSNGMQLSDFYFYHTDTTSNKQNQVPVEIQSSSVFPFEADEQNPSVLLFKIKWNDPEPTGTEYTLIRNRQFAGDTTYIYQGKTYDAIKIYVRELIDNYNKGHLEQEYDGQEIYAKGLGLVYFRKNISDDFIIQYKLKDTYPMTTLENKFKTATDKQ